MRVLFAGGGTGGHIYPALALARHLVAADRAEVLFVGTLRGMEKELIPAAGFRLETIPVVGMQRRFSLQAGRAVFLAASAVFAAGRLIRMFKPDLVVGTGGYVAGPVVLAAFLSRIPTVIHEQNSIPGLTNILLSRIAGRVCLSFPGTEHYFPRQARTVFTGNPRASEAVSALGKETVEVLLRPQRPLFLCVGGSHGAAKLNLAFSEAVGQVLPACDAQAIYITGKRYFAELEAKLAALTLRFPNRLHILPYHPDLPELLRKADLIISRAGATTLAEITALGVPALLVPSPNVTNNHQEHNARFLAEQGAAVLLKESNLSGQSLSELLIELLADGKRLKEMAAASRTLGVPDAAERMAEIIRKSAK
ncbi:MAG: undecaprenyldiphospho-muramoylpentapeptide beta-N-acetylglucosaminyltransferase [Clostridium sp.]|nr:undecaprenyldiphospho-muramoylpentapeptide beta-N-acetylglucosaminyltransferase [Clostridium sp.]